jgi:hypothetical protein
MGASGSEKRKTALPNERGNKTGQVTNLVDHRLDSGDLEQVLEILDCEIADANAPVLDDRQAEDDRDRRPAYFVSPFALNVSNCRHTASKFPPTTRG